MKAFLAAFDILPGCLWALLLAGALAFGGVKVAQLATARTATAEARAELADYKATVAESARLAARAALAETERINLAQRKAIDDANDKTLRAQTERAAADAASVGLRQQLDKFRSAVRRATEASAVAQGSAPAGDPIGVLANVLERCDKRAGVLADFADRSRIAGQLCERSYDALVGN